MASQDDKRQGGQERADAPSEGEGGFEKGGREPCGRGVGTDEPTIARPSHQDQANGQNRTSDQQNKQGGKSGRQTPLWRLLLYCAAIALVCSIVVAGATVYFLGESSDKSSGNAKTLSKGSSNAGSKTGSSKKADSADGSASGERSGSSSESSSTGESGSSDDSTSTNNSDPRTTSSKKKSSETAKLLEAQSAEKSARQSAEDAKAIVDFLKTTLLSAGRPGGESLTEAFWSGGKGKDVTLRKAVDAAEARAGDAFADRPLAEASVREMLGMAYLNLGEPAQAVHQYERAFALRKAYQGASHPDTAACRNQLAVAYRLAGRADEGAHLFETRPDSPREARALSASGSMLLEQKKAAEAELKLRQALAILQKTQPDDWTTFDTESALGEALLNQQKYAEAEPLLLSGYEGLRLRDDSMPPRDKPRVKKALERLVKLYEAWGKKDEATRWKKQLGVAG
jgi:tetratricopeptide (TPR) repeat protein